MDEAARRGLNRTIELMRQTFAKVPPMKIVGVFVAVGHGGKAASDALWDEFGDETLEVMRDGAHLIGLLWESAWQAGDGERTITRAAALDKADAMAIVADPDFLPSMTISQIGQALRARP